MASSENELQIYGGPVLAPGPHILSDLLLLGRPLDPSGVISEAPNGPAGCRPVSRRSFSNQITIFNGATSPGPSPNRHLLEMAARNYPTQKLPLSPLLAPLWAFVCCCLFAAETPPSGC